MVRYYGPESRIATAVGVISVVMAEIIFNGAMMSLYFSRNPGWRLRLVAFWASIFSLSVSIPSIARRAEVLGAGAAYAAVILSNLRRCLVDCSHGS